MEGLQLANYVSAILFIILTTIVVSLRYATRIHIKGFGTDDWLMVFGHILFLAVGAVQILGSKSGLGILDKDLTVEQIVNTRHHVFEFELLYCVCFMFVKSSIGFGLLRINNNVYIKWGIYGVTFVSVASGFIPLVVIGSLCTPVSGAWTGIGKCRPTSQVYHIVIFITVTSIITDFAFCIFPYVILRNLQMKKTRKWIIALLLSLTFVASGLTVVRAFFFTDYLATADYPCTVIVFASAPSLKPLLGFLGAGTKRLGSKYNRSTRMQSADTESGNARSSKYYNMEVLKSSTRPNPIEEDEEDLIRNSVIVVSSEYVVRSDQGSKQ
ncbi:hypothetical protein D6D01_09065 [Aureobasidium pullulans]|uniref:Rhodopsin domain-containing protein n=1 Tax=Aureobasidium pullulans TaxID=5580 RepID=A0A4S9K7N3_AURPU|nr:hypothetical protein D6D01_09065 [Aureobasidium pullulans]